MLALDAFLSEKAQGFTIDDLYKEITGTENNLGPEIKREIDKILGKK